MALTTQFRQHDEAFTAMLNELRLGIVSRSTIDMLGVFQRVYELGVTPASSFARVGGLGMQG